MDLKKKVKTIKSSRYQSRWDMGSLEVSYLGICIAFDVDILKSV